MRSLLIQSVSTFICACYLLYSCQTEENVIPSTYTLTAHLDGYEEGEVVELSYSQKILGQGRVKDGQVTFAGSVTEPLDVTLNVVALNEKKRFWLDTGDITFYSQKGNLEQAVIEGSKTQDQNEVLKKRTKHLTDRIMAAHKKRGSVSGEEYERLKQEFDSLQVARYRYNQDFIIDFPGSIVSHWILDIYKARWEFSEVQSLYQLIEETGNETSYSSSVGEYVELNADVQLGDKYVDFTMPDVTGENILFSSLRADYTLIEFWAGWCGPCRASNPDLVEVYKRFSPCGLQIVGVSLDQKMDVWKDAIAADGLPWPQLGDLRGHSNVAASIYDVDGIPDNLLVNPDGVVIARMIEVDSLDIMLSTLIPCDKP